jgi:hypothetical protein
VTTRDPSDRANANGGGTQGRCEYSNEVIRREIRARQTPKRYREYRSSASAMIALVALTADGSTDTESIP